MLPEDTEFVDRDAMGACRWPSRRVSSSTGNDGSNQKDVAR